MATITAKYTSSCPTCGGRIRVGDKVEWSSGTKARHVRCAAPTPARQLEREIKAVLASSPPPSRKASTPREAAPGAREISRRKGKYTVGETFHAPKLPGGGGSDGHYWTVLSARFQRANEDIGDYDDLYLATVRPATDAEAVPVTTRIASADARKSVESAIERALKYDAPGVTAVTDTGKLPPASEIESKVVIGRKTGSSGAVTDGGTTYAVTASEIVAHHGGYYDDYRSSTRSRPRTMLLAQMVAALAANDAAELAVLADASREGRI